MKSKQRARARFGAFELDLKTGELYKSGEVLLLQEQPFRVLRMLVEYAGDVVTREEIKKRLWPNDTVVEFDHSINTAIKKLRHVLSDSVPDDPQYIQTIARRGYRLLVPVEWLENTDSSSSDDSGALPLQVGSRPANSVILIGKRISHYRVLEVVGGGGMGVVYKGEDLKLGRRVALKFLPEELSDDPIARERFEREARAASALQHSNICPIYEFGEHEGQPFIAMQLLEGQTLRERLAHSRLSNDELLHIAVSVCNGLEAAHCKGIIHRDIKPANVFITDQGEVKILDFGLAKVASELSEVPDPAVSANQQGKASDGSPSLTLTRTGVALGTAHYMSPEQVRGEKLDARTDLFSFGLVLYEMATGRQAFAGDTVAIVHDAILNRTPPSASDLGLTISLPLEKIINKALQKDREQRYQSAADLHTDLIGLQGVSDSTRTRKRIIGLAAAVTIILVLVAGAFWWARHKFTPVEVSSVPPFKQRQLTTNTSDDPVTDAAISPNGEQVAYVDQKGIHVRTISTGFTQSLRLPALPNDVQATWTVGPWFHDNSRLIVFANVAGQRPSTWLYPSIRESAQKLSDDAGVSDVSPDDSSLVFTRGPGAAGGDRELWIMDANGEHARKVFEIEEDSFFMGGAVWSPDGKALRYQRFRQTAAKGEEFLESRDLSGGPPTLVLTTGPWWQQGGLRGAEWLPHGRVIYILGENDINGFSCNLWEIRVDEQTGKPISQPRQLTNWAGSCVQSLIGTADGKRLEFLRFSFQRSVQVAELEQGGSRISHLRKLTISEGNEYPMGWTADSKAVIFHSNRNGSWGIFLQGLDSEVPEVIVQGTQDSAPAASTLTPDGSSVIYTEAPTEQGGSSTPPTRILRVPVKRGEPRLVMTAPLLGAPRCTRSPANLCAIAERSPDGRQIIFTSLDPQSGRGRELLRFPIEPDGVYSWALSLDGSNIAILRQPSRRIDMVSLTTGRTQAVFVKHWDIGIDARVSAGDRRDGWVDFEWAADGRGFFTSGQVSKRSVLLYVDLHGDAYVLREQKGGLSPTVRGGFTGPWGVPSPDGRHLAILNWTRNQNVWMMENF